MPSAQQFEEVETALRSGSGEPGELRVANLGAEAVRGLVWRAPVSSTVIQVALDKPARNTPRAS